MKLLRSSLVLVVVLVLIPCVSTAQPPAAGSAGDREQILQLERDWTQSFVTMDVAANERIVADDFLGTEPDGKRVKKSDLIAELKAGDALEANRLNEDDVTIRFYGQTAIVNGSESWKRKSDGKTGRFIWTDILVKRNGKWQVVASQDLEVLDKK
ncbi:MAG: nuclear transport factor 2 family protein [Terriglobales bacterium]